MRSDPIEVACDESGFSGSNLLDPRDPVITHAAVHLDTAEATEVVQAIRARFRYSPREYKANQLLRRIQRPVLEWLLEPGGPLHGRATVHLTDKTFFVESRLVDYLLGEPSYAAGTSLDPTLHQTALHLHLQAPAEFGAERWTDFLIVFASMMRTKRHRIINRPAVDRFFRTLDGLRSDAVDLDPLRGARPQVEAVLTELLDDRAPVPPALEPLLPALVETALHWTSNGQSVVLVHDEQSALTRHRIARIQQVLNTHQHTALEAVVMVDSRTDPRVQLADLLAGTARRLAITPAADELTGLLSPYVVPTPLWPYPRVTNR